MTAHEILKKHEDANEMHFHEVDRKWLIEAMEEYASLHKRDALAISDQLLPSVTSLQAIEGHNYKP